MSYEDEDDKSDRMLITGGIARSKGANRAKMEREREREVYAAQK